MTEWGEAGLYKGLRDFASPVEVAEREQDLAWLYGVSTPESRRRAAQADERQAARLADGLVVADTSFELVEIKTDDPDQVAYYMQQGAELLAAELRFRGLQIKGWESEWADKMVAQQYRKPILDYYLGTFAAKLARAEGVEIKGWEN